MKHFVSQGEIVGADCSHEIKTLTPWKESYDQPRHSMLKSRDITLSTKIGLVKATDSSVVMVDVKFGDVGLQNIPLKVNAVCVHEIHEAIMN